MIDLDHIAIWNDKWCIRLSNTVIKIHHHVYIYFPSPQIKSNLVFLLCPFCFAHRTWWFWWMAHSYACWNGDFSKYMYMFLHIARGFHCSPCPDFMFEHSWICFQCTTVEAPRQAGVTYTPSLPWDPAQTGAPALCCTETWVMLTLSPFPGYRKMWPRACMMLSFMWVSMGYSFLECILTVHRSLQKTVE